MIFLCSVATAASATTGAEGLSKTEIISISSVLGALLCTLIIAGVTVCGWYVKKKKRNETANNLSKYTNIKKHVALVHTVYVWTINEPHLPYKTGLDVIQSHPLRRTRFGQYQATSAALGWPGDGDCHIMHRMQSGGWPYSKVGRDSSKAPSLRAAVFRSKILHSDHNHWSSRVIGA